MFLIFSCVASNRIKNVRVKEIIKLKVIRNRFEEKKDKLKGIEKVANLKSAFFNIFYFTIVIFWFCVRGTILEVMEEDDTDSMASARTLSSGEVSEEDEYF